MRWMVMGIKEKYLVCVRCTLVLIKNNMWEEYSSSPTLMF